MFAYFKVIMQSDDVLVSLGYALEHGDFVADLCVWEGRCDKRHRR